jgi:hypothetical protein
MASGSPHWRQSEPTLVPAAVAAAVGLMLPTGEASADHVACALAQKELLLFIDNCEHVIGGAGTMAEAILHANSAAHVVATSREPIGCSVTDWWLFQSTFWEIKPAHALASNASLRVSLRPTADPIATAVGSNLIKM